jgi:hypothetical protein
MKTYWSLLITTIWPGGFIDEASGYKNNKYLQAESREGPSG